MDQGERALQDALAALERDRARAEERALAAEAESRRVREREAAVIEREEKAKRRLRELEAGVATEFAAKLRVAEHSIAQVIADLQREPTSKRAAAAREEIETLAAVLDDVELVPADVVDVDSPLEVGSAVRVPALGLTGEVVALRDREVEVRARGMTLKLRPNEVEVTGRASAGGPASPGVGKAERRRPAFDAASLTRALRTESNTLDLRGARVAEGLAALDEFLDAAVLAGADAVFVLHGHGTGVLKIAVRKALADSPYVAGSGPAEPDQGGDAFTVAILR